MTKKVKHKHKKKQNKYLHHTTEMYARLIVMNLIFDLWPRKPV